MKPLQIALLVVAGAACGAVVTRLVQGPGAAPAVKAPVVKASAGASSAQAVPATAPATPPVAAAVADTTPVPPAAAAPPPPAPVAGSAPPSRPWPVTERRLAKARQLRPARSEPLTMARSVPARIAPPPAAIPAPAPASPTAPAPVETPAAAAPATVQPEPPPPDLSSARTMAENTTPTIPQAAPPSVPNRATLNAGLLIPVRLVDGLSSDRNQPGDTFHATLEKELVADGFVIAERGARVEGRVVAADRGGKVGGAASLAVVLTTIHTLDGQAMPVDTDPFHRHAEQTHLQDAATIGGAAALGAIMGGIAGGGKGAAAGAGIGGGVGAGAVLLSRGASATLPPETRLSFRLKIPVTITERH